MINPMHILIDGIDGAGKSSLCNAVRGILESKPEFGVLPITQIHQPDARHLHGRAHSKDVTHLERVLHFLANRRQQVEALPKVVGPHVVLCDRGAPATWVYDKVYGFEPYARKVTEQMIGLCNRGIEPFIFVWLDTLPQEAHARLQKRGEKETLLQLQELRYGFQLFMDRNPFGWKWLTTMPSQGSLSDMANEIVKLVEPQLKLEAESCKIHSAQSIS
jgi:thymidylate kinase